MRHQSRLSLVVLSLLALVVFAPADLVLQRNQSALAQASTEPLKPVIIVLRHGADLDTDVKGVECVKSASGLSAEWKALGWANSEFTFADGKAQVLKIAGKDGTTLNNTQTSEYHSTRPSVTTVATSVSMRQHCLSPTGESQANRLKAQLPDILKSRGYAPVTRVITINPLAPSQYAYPTANPFNTVLPFMLGNADFQAANKRTPTSLLLLDNQNQTDLKISKQLQAMLNIELDLNEATASVLLPEDGGSTILCWEGGQLSDTADGILQQLQGATITKRAPQLGPVPGASKPVRIGKGNTLYLFAPRPGTGPKTAIPKQDFDLDIYRAVRNLDGSSMLRWVSTYFVVEQGTGVPPAEFTTVQLTEPKYEDTLVFCD